MKRAWDEIDAYVMANARNDRKGYRLRDITDVQLLRYAADEMDELRAAPDDLDELADLFGCLFHYAQRKGWTMEAIESEVIRKLALRFPEARERLGRPAAEPTYPRRHPSHNWENWLRRDGSRELYCIHCKITSPSLNDRLPCPAAPGTSPGGRTEEDDWNGSGPATEDKPKTFPNHNWIQREDMDTPRCLNCGAYHPMRGAAPCPNAGPPVKIFPTKSSRDLASPVESAVSLAPSPVPPTTTGEQWKPNPQSSAYHAQGLSHPAESAAPGDRLRFRRTKSQVAAERGTVMGCCSDFADHIACSCLEEAVDG